MGRRTNGPSDQWVGGPMGRRTNEPSDQWVVGPMGRQTNGLSDYRAVPRFDLLTRMVIHFVVYFILVQSLIRETSPPVDSYDYGLAYIFK